MRISLVATVLNECGSLPAWLDALAVQSTPPDEFIVVDGGSTDGTLELLRSARLPFPMIVMSAGGCNISQGRNIGIGVATGDVIAVTDAGTRAEREWLAALTRPFAENPELDIVGGFFTAQADDLWTEALAAATLPDADELDAPSFLASSRSVAFRRRWFERGFAYPEWLDYCEDVVFDLHLRRAGARQALATEAIVVFRPRPSPRDFFFQYYRYARGDGKAGLFLHRHLIRYGVYAIACALAARRRPRELAVAGIAGAFYVRRAVWRLLRRGSTDANRRLALQIVLAGQQIALGDAAKMAGYPAGLWWRFRRDRSVKFWKSGWKARNPTGHLPRI